MPQDRLLAHLQGMQERRLLRRVAAILFHRRAGFSANGMGVWKVPEERIMELGPRMAAVRGISHCYQRPTYADWPYSVFTMAHGRSKDECDAILDSIAEDTGHRGALDALLLDRVQEDPPPLLHRRVQALGSGTPGAAGSAAAARARRAVRASAALDPRRGQLSGPGDDRDRARPDLRGARRGRRARRRRRQPLRGLRHVVGPADRRARAPGRGRRRGRRRAPRHELRRADRGRGRAGRGGRAPGPERGDGAHDLVGHRGVDERDPAGARGRPAATRWSSSPAPTTGTWTACWPRPARASPPRASPPAPA